MARKKANYPLIEGLEITTLAAEGKAMGRWNDVVVFVPLTVPGDVVDVQIRSKRRRFMEGFVVRYVKKSPLRAEAFCEHFGVCGGCKWQNLPYEEQLRFKTEQVRDQLTRIGKIALPEIAARLGHADCTVLNRYYLTTVSDQRDIINALAHFDTGPKPKTQKNPPDAATSNGSNCGQNNPTQPQSNHTIHHLSCKGGEH